MKKLNINIDPIRFAFNVSFLVPRNVSKGRQNRFPSRLAWLGHLLALPVDSTEHWGALEASSVVVVLVLQKTKTEERIRCCWKQRLGMWDGNSKKLTMSSENGLSF